MAGQVRVGFFWGIPRDNYYPFTEQYDFCRRKFEETAFFLELF
jgi:hypothetical protein